MISCSRPDAIGEDILASANISESPDTFNVKLSTYIKDSIATDVDHSESLKTIGSTSYPINMTDFLYTTLGSINDPQFGRIDGGCAFELKTFGSNLDFGTNASLDSVELRLGFLKSYGNVNYSHKIEIYELQERLPESDSRFYANQIPDYIPTELSGNKSFIVKQPTTIDTATTINFKLTNQFGEKILKAPTSSLVSDDEFVKYFKGFYIKTGIVNTISEGVLHPVSILSADLNRQARMRLHYKYDKDSTVFDSLKQTNVTITFRKTTYYDFKIDYSCRYVRTLTRTAAGNSIYQKIIDQKVDTDKYALIQGVHPLKIKVEIPHFETLENKVINYAELIFKIDPGFMDPAISKPPRELFLYGTETINGKLRENFALYLGTAAYDSTKQQYKFICTTFFQQVFLKRENSVMILKAFDYQTSERGPERAVIGNFNNVTFKPSFRVLYTESPS